MINLLKKAYAHLHDIKISQKIASLALTGALVFGLTACSLSPANNNENINQNENQNNENNENDQNNQEVIYSEILTNLLENEEYDSLVKRVKSGNINILSSPVLQPHPYAFLDDRGVDVDAILNGTNEAYTLSYTLDSEPNNLYMYTRVKNSDHYELFHIKYALTDQEMTEYNTLHADAFGSRFYIQAFFMNNEISKAKDAEILGTSKIAFKVYDGLQRDVDRKKYFNNSTNNFIATNFDKEKGTYDMVILPILGKWTKMSISHDIYIASELQINSFFAGDIFTAYAGISFPTQPTQPGKLYLTQEFNHSASSAYDFETEQ